MAFKERRENNAGERVVEINAHMNGSLSFKDPVNLKINGKFDGTLETRGTLTIGESAYVDAHINGENIVIAGKVKGDVTAKRMLAILPTGVLHGNISTPKLNIVEGAIFEGKCHMFDEYLDIDELAKYLEIDTTSIVELANTGKIPASKNGNAWRFERTKIDEWAASEKVR